MKRILAPLAGALLAAALGSAALAQEPRQVTMAVSIPAADHGWTGGVVYHAERAKAQLEKRYPGLKVVLKTSPDGASQANALEDLTAQGMDALVTLPHNSDELTDPIRQVKEKGTFVTVVDRALSDPSIQDLYVAGNNPELGRVAGEYIKERMPNGGDVVVIRGLPIVIDEERQKGFDEGIAGSQIKVLDRQFGNWSRDDAFRVMQDYLSKHPKIDAVWAQDDDMVVGVLEAIQQSGRSDIQFVVGGAGMKDMIKRVADGDKMVPVDVLYPPAMIATAMELTAANFYDQNPIRGSYILDATLVTKDNASEFYYPDSPF
ncbi:substrate-binding domain-containing protein [Aureimonas jatrophae]|jgi:ribose transport system substrate-binding protein|uniref:Monosaccharide ABC transporter substrate-binding protein, CUT2 family n=1 Tax=Aureimonas jatrophae TaxID=1166073 RepID=A0A1H0HWP0_9HYPH|nr:substrate-binding domain-containing protein [Aureimonas jatrophae]MBB3950816.1 ribose transport system substrate-binding protein [Aureimonas jatrophae]SDO23586.1 monosaccharide ABC transporter substrate-binding protein, CUT2 family [Aureimonas jatrophae]